MTPVDKGGGNVMPVNSYFARADGNAFLYPATSPFEGVPAESGPLLTRYLATRSASGWTNRPLDPPWDPIPPAANATVMAVSGTSLNLAFAVVTSSRALAPGAIPGGGNLYLRNTATGAYRLIAAHPSNGLSQMYSTIGSGPNVKYVASDGKAVVFSTRFGLVDGVPDGLGAAYRWTEDEGIELVSKLPDAEGGGYVPVGASVLGFRSENLERNSLPRTNGADVIYFSAEGGAAYRWEDGEVSAISRSEISEDDGRTVAAQVRATTSNGDYALLQTDGAERLTEDTPSFGDETRERLTARVLYRYQRSTRTLEYVGVASQPVYDPAQQMSDDGRTIVFMSQHQLTADAAEFYGWDENGNDDVRNRLNLYAWRDGTLHFVASFGPEGLQNGGIWIRLLSDNGRYLTFVDRSQESASRVGVADNTSRKCAAPGSDVAALCDQVYLFDTELPGTLKCASCRPGGAPPQGHSGDPGLVPGEMQLNARPPQNVLDDGTVFFTSSADLVGDDSNGLLDAYAYRNGQLRLVSPAVQGASARFLDATLDGSSVFFATNAQLAETDVDRATDVYVTRLGAGFPFERPDVPPPCTGGDCRAAVPDPDTGGGASASSLLPNLPVGGASSPAKTRVRLTGVVRRGSALRVSVRTSVAGHVRVTGRQVRTTSRRAPGAGNLTFSVPLTKASRATIRRKGRVRTRIRLSLSPPFGKAAVIKSTRTVR